jgi:hypothetical protein
LRVVDQLAGHKDRGAEEEKDGEEVQHDSSRGRFRARLARGRDSDRGTVGSALSWFFFVHLLLQDDLNRE